MARYSRTQYDDNLDAAKTAALRTDSAFREAQATGFYRDPIRGVTYNLNYNPRLLSQGHTVDPSTGQTIPGAAYSDDLLLGGGSSGGGGGSSYHDRLLGQGLTVDPSTGHRIPGAFGGRGLTGATRSELQKRRLAERDVEAARDAFTSGEIGVGQLSKVNAAIEAQYGPEALIHIPGWRQMNARASQMYETQKEAAMQAHANRLDIKREAVTWNDVEGKPETDQEYMEVQALKSKMAAEAAKPIAEVRKFNEEMADTRLRQELDKAETRQLAASKEKDGAQFVKAQADKDAAYDRYYAERHQLRGGGQQAAPVLTHPKLPTNVRIQAEYPSVAAAGAGLQPGQYGLSGGRLVRKTVQGTLEEVK